jgi:hypothetical protein
MSDLIVIGYPNEDTAQRVYDELMRLETTWWSTWRMRPSSGVTAAASCT